MMEIGFRPFAVPTAPYRLSATPAQIRTMPPRFGQHTDQILVEHGYTQEEIAALRASGTV